MDRRGDPKCRRGATKCAGPNPGQNADTEYLKGFNVDKETFKSKVPMVTHQDIQPLIRRIADGDSSPLLCAQPISEFYWSSGTSGEPKLIPSTKEVLHRNLFLFHLLDDVMDM
ncbi:probable indole-3-acetic acid-amido synthetase gh3.1 [Phtheirospermum japonicum]|uniref:Probable indole-3-acetic acid-amido synthetase gh3.1 n=1 Tax=Phtheirospermum japonicum TaxID=374723 RepID=A0A830DPK8_9LAMI|nr:probable indole-3-acetic acid-amido synthetase gh3.1 [Phtheirospermum japonicum]